MKGYGPREERTTAVTVGVLYVACTAAGLAAKATGAPTELVAMADARGAVVLSTLCVVVMALTAMGIAAMLYPLLAREAATDRRRGMAVWYVGTRVAEGALFLVVAAMPLVKLTLAETPSAAGAETVAQALDAFSEYGAVTAQSAFCIGAVLASWLLLVSGRVPRSLALLGLVGAPMMLAGGLLLPFTNDPDSTVSTLLYAPLAVQEMVLAVWLIGWGFRPARRDTVRSSDAALAEAHAR